MSKMNQENIIQIKSFEFALSIIDLYKNLQAEKEYVISKQLLRSATSVGANIEEATAAQTKRDFAHKMSISSKEAREARYWIRLLEKSQLVKGNYQSYLNDITEIIRILTSIVKTAQKSL